MLVTNHSCAFSHIDDNMIRNIYEWWVTFEWKSMLKVYCYCICVYPWASVCVIVCYCTDLQYVSGKHMHICPHSLTGALPIVSGRDPENLSEQNIGEEHEGWHWNLRGCRTRKCWTGVWSETNVLFWLQHHSEQWHRYNLDTSKWGIPLSCGGHTFQHKWKETNCFRNYSKWPWRVHLFGHLLQYKGIRKHHSRWARFASSDDLIC